MGGAHSVSSRHAVAFAAEVVRQVLLHLWRGVSLRGSAGGFCAFQLASPARSGNALQRLRLGFLETDSLGRW
jgi:hypothetical protein